MNGKLFLVVAGLGVWSAAFSPALSAADPVAVLSVADLNDPAFDRHCRPGLIVQAWDRLDGPLMADAALMLAEGERVLGRSRKGLSADDLFRLAVKLNADKGNKQELARLQQAAERSGKGELAAFVASSTKLAGTSRDTTSQILIPIEDVNPSEMMFLGATCRALKQAALVGDTALIDRVEKHVPTRTEFVQHPDYQKHIEEMIKNARAALPAKPVVAPSLAKTLNLLRFLSRPGELEPVTLPVDVAGSY